MHCPINMNVIIFSRSNPKTHIYAEPLSPERQAALKDQALHGRMPPYTSGADSWGYQVWHFSAKVDKMYFYRFIANLADFILHG